VQAVEHRIHIFGASGTGTTTLGGVLGERLRIPHFDTDDYFWAPSDVPFSVIRKRNDREAMLRTALESSDSWVLSGSVCDWGDFAIPMFTLAVFLYVPREIRMKRLRKREAERFGEEALKPGGYMHDNHRAFIEWAGQYDAGGPDMRSLVMHEEWMKELPCEVLRFEGELCMASIAGRIEQSIRAE
jgi:adenylate kinase family enzyme